MTREELEAAVRHQVQRALDEGKRLAREGGRPGTTVDVITICIMAQVDAVVAAHQPGGA